MEGSGHVEVANDVGSKHEDIEEAKVSDNFKFKNLKFR